MPEDTRAPADAGRRRLVSTVVQLAVGVILSLFTRTQCRMRLARPPGFTLEPSTVVVLTHRRDLDIPLLIRTLLGPRTWRTWTGRVAFVGTSELYVTGFLGLYFPQLGPLRRWLAYLSLRPVLRALRIFPVPQAGPRLVAAWLDELVAVYGEDQPVGGLLSGEALAEAGRAGITPSMRLGEVRDPRYRDWLARDAGPELLEPEVHRHLRVAATTTARSQLALLAAVLQEGNALVIAPEGNVSPDGTLQPFRSGLYRLLQAAPEAAVLPVGMTYDLLLPGRPVAFVRMGSPMKGLSGLPRAACERAVRQQLGRLSTITLAQIAGSVVLDELGPETTVADAAWLADRVFARAGELAKAGYAVDGRLLLPERFRALWSRFLGCAQGRGLTTAGGTVQIDHRILSRPVRGWVENPLGYGRNELTWILRTAQRRDEEEMATGAGRGKSSQINQW